MITVDTREIQPSHESTGEKETLNIVNIKAEPGSTTGARLLHGILSQHPQQHGLGVATGYARHMTNHNQLVQQNYNTNVIANTNTPGKLIKYYFIIIILINITYYIYLISNISLNL